MRRLGGVVLCGGQSRRMGQSKAWLPLGETTLLAEVVRRLQAAASQVVVAAAPGQVLPPLPEGTPIGRDSHGGLGPLVGLAAGLALLRDEVEAVYLASCDAPFLCPAFVRILAELLGENEICIPLHQGRLQPLAAVYGVSVEPVVRQLLAGGGAGPLALTEHVRTRVVAAGELVDVDPGLQSLWNINTPQEYERALRHHAELCD